MSGRAGPHIPQRQSSWGGSKKDPPYFWSSETKPCGNTPLYVLTFVKACDAWVIRKGRWPPAAHEIDRRQTAAECDASLEEHARSEPLGVDYWNTTPVPLTDTDYTHNCLCQCPK